MTCPRCDHLSAELSYLRSVLQQIAERTLQRDLNRLAHEALGHVPNPQTVRMLAELKQETGRPA